ncbi:MAG TPA: rhomboid family intramembrane serine protease [bacterium]|nr:rhomboid family intramembrane serine protease [bacterium]
MFGCIIATIASWARPLLGDTYSLHPFFLLMGEYADFAFQVVLFQFFHADIWHLLGNSLSLLIFGNVVERIMGTTRYAWFFIASTLFVSLLILLFSRAPTVGISGFAMAVFAYLALELRAQRHPEFGGIAAMVAINIAIGFLPQISLIGHAAGAVFGVIAFFLPRLFRANARR